MNDPLDDFSVSDPFRTWWPFLIALIVGIITAFRSYIGGPDCPSDEKVNGKLIVLTGGSKGIGFEVALELLNRGGNLIIGTRNVEKTLAHFKSAKKCPEVLYLDLTDFASIKEFSEKIGQRKINALINNAGAFFVEPHCETECGTEISWTTNYLGPFLLTEMLKTNFEKGCRLIFTAAQAHRLANGEISNAVATQSKYSNVMAFAKSKLAVLLLTRHLAKLLTDRGVTVNAVHPGAVRNTQHLPDNALKNSLILKIMAWLLWKSPKQAAQTIIYLVVAEKVQCITGKYFMNCQEVAPSKQALDDELAETLYKETVDFLAVNKFLY